MIASASAPPDSAPAGAGNQSAADVWAATFAAQNAHVDGLAADAIHAHELGEYHLGRFQMRRAIFTFQSGARGTALSAATSQPCGADLPHPGELLAWAIKVPKGCPAGSATFGVSYAAPGVDPQSATLISGAGVPTLSGARSAEGDILGVWSTTSVEKDGYLTAELLTVATLEAVELHLLYRGT